tara:strand:+ start:260 stop:2242 length:1983 start_codon:yes stop_codon:yes gene_type:complete
MTFNFDDDPTTVTASTKKVEGSTFYFDDVPGTGSKDTVSKDSDPKDKPQEPSKQGTTMDMVDRIKRSFGRYSEGAIGMALGEEKEKHSNPLGLPELTHGETLKAPLRDALGRHAQSQDVLEEEAKKNSPLATMLVGIPSEIAASTAFLGAAGSARKVVGQGIKEGSKALAKNMASASLISGAQSEVLGDDMLTGAAIGGAAATAFPAAGKLLQGADRLVGAVLPTGRLSSYVASIFQPKQLAKKELAKQVSRQISGADDLTDMQIAAKLRKTQGVKEATPAQLLGGEDLVSKQNTMVVDEGAKKALMQKNAVQIKTATTQLRESLDNITPEGLEETTAKASKLFAMADKHFADPANKVRPKVTEAITNNKALTDIALKLNKQQQGEAVNLGNESFGMIQAIKAKIDDKIFTGVHAPVGSKKPDKNIIRGLRDAREVLMAPLRKDKTLMEALETSQKVIVRNNWETKLSEAMEVVPTGQGGLKQINNHLFGGGPKQSLAKKTEFLEDVYKTGGDVEQAKKVIRTLKQFTEAPLTKLAGSAAEPTVDTALTGGTKAIVQRFASHDGLSEYKQAVLDLMLSGPKWKKQITKFLETPEGSPERSAGIVRLLKLVLSKPLLKTKVGGSTTKVSTQDVSKAVASGAPVATSAVTPKEKKKQGYLSR